MYQPDHGRKARARSVEAHVAFVYDSTSRSLDTYSGLMQISRAICAWWNDERLAKVIAKEGQRTGLDSPLCLVRCALGLVA